MFNNNISLRKYFNLKYYFHLQTQKSILPWEQQWLYPAHPATNGLSSHFSIWNIARIKRRLLRMEPRRTLKECTRSRHWYTLALARSGRTSLACSWSSPLDSKSTPSTCPSASQSQCFPEEEWCFTGTRQITFIAYPCSPLQPQFEDVIVSSALDDLVSCVIAAVVALVCLEQVVCRHLVTADQQALNKEPL